MPHRTIDVLWLIPAGLALSLWLSHLLFFDTGFAVWDPSDQMDLAQLARNISEGKGFVSSVSRPLEQRFTPGLPHPELARGPGLPLLLGSFMALFGENRSVLLLPLGLLHAICAASTALFAHLLTRDRIVGILAGILYASSPLALLYATNVSVEIPYATLILLSLLFFQWAPTGHLPQVTAWIVAGFFLGLASTFRFSAAFFLPALLLPRLILTRESPRKKGSFLLWTLLGLSLPLVPLLLRNIIATGHFTSPVYRYTPLLSPGVPQGYALWCSLTLPEPPPLIPDLTSAWTSLIQAVRLLPKVTSARIWLAGLAGIFLLARRQNAWLLALAILFTVHLGTSILVGHPSLRYGSFLLPLICALAGVTAGTLVRLLPGRCMGMAILLGSLFLTWPWIPSASQRETARWARQTDPYRQATRWVSQHLPPGATILTDIPWPLAWYGNYQACWLTRRPGEVKDLIEFLDLDAIVLTDLHTQGCIGWTEEWVTILNRPAWATYMLPGTWESLPQEEENMKILILKPSHLFSSVPVD